MKESFRSKRLPGYMANERPIRAKVGIGPLAMWAVRRHDFEKLEVGLRLKLREPVPGAQAFEVVINNITTETSEPHYYAEKV